MRLVSFTSPEGASSWGVLNGRRIVDTGRLPDLEAPTFRVALTTSSLLDIAMGTAGMHGDWDIAEVELKSPIPDPAHVCVDGLGQAARCLLGVSPWTTPHATLGVAVVVANPTHHVPTANALEHIAGVMLAAPVPDDLETWRCGPVLVTRDEWEMAQIDDPSVDEHARSAISALDSHGRAALLDAISRASQNQQLVAGDVIVLP